MCQMLNRLLGLRRQTSFNHLDSATLCNEASGELDASHNSIDLILRKQKSELSVRQHALEILFGMETLGLGGWGFELWYLDLYCISDFAFNMRLKTFVWQSCKHSLRHIQAAMVGWRMEDARLKKLISMKRTTNCCMLVGLDGPHRRPRTARVGCPQSRHAQRRCGQSPRPPRRRR